MESKIAKLQQLQELQNTSNHKQIVTNRFRKHADQDVGFNRDCQRKALVERQKLLKINNELMLNAQKQKEELEELEKELCILLQETQIKDEEKKLASECLSSSISDKEIMKQKIESMELQCNEKLSDLQKTDRLFQERLGLKFKSTAGAELEISFTSIDPKDISKPFSFTVKFDNGSYIVSNAQPGIEDLNTFTQRLNKTNSFRSFIIAVRQCYKKKYTLKT